MCFSRRYLPCHKVEEGGHGQNDTGGPLWEAWYLDSSDGRLGFGSLAGVWVWPQGMLFVVLVSRTPRSQKHTQNQNEDCGLQTWLWLLLSKIHIATQAWPWLHLGTSHDQYGLAVLLSLFLSYGVSKKKPKFAPVVLGHWKPSRT